MIQEEGLYVYLHIIVEEILVYEKPVRNRAASLVMDKLHQDTSNDRGH